MLTETSTETSFSEESTFAWTIHSNNADNPDNARENVRWSKAWANAFKGKPEELMITGYNAYKDAPNDDARSKVRDKYLSIIANVVKDVEVGRRCLEAAFTEADEDLKSGLQPPKEATRSERIRHLWGLLAKDTVKAGDKNKIAPFIRLVQAWGLGFVAQYRLNSKAVRWIKAVSNISQALSFEQARARLNKACWLERDKWLDRVVDPLHDVSANLVEAIEAGIEADDYVLPIFKYLKEPLPADVQTDNFGIVTKSLINFAKYSKSEQEVYTAIKTKTVKDLLASRGPALPTAHEIVAQEATDRAASNQESHAGLLVTFKQSPRKLDLQEPTPLEQDVARTLDTLEQKEAADDQAPDGESSNRNGTVEHGTSSTTENRDESDGDRRPARDTISNYDAEVRMNGSKTLKRVEEDGENGASEEDKENGASDKDAQDGASEEDEENGASEEDEENGASDEDEENGASEKGEESGASEEKGEDEGNEEDNDEDDDQESDSVPRPDWDERAARHKKGPARRGRKSSGAASAKAKQTSKPKMPVFNAVVKPKPQSHFVRVSIPSGIGGGQFNKGTNARKMANSFRDWAKVWSDYFDFDLHVYPFGEGPRDDTGSHKRKR